MISSSELRLKILTFKHHARQKIFDILASPSAPIYVKVGGVIGAIFALFTILQVLSWILSLVFFHSDRIAYIKDYYDPKTPRYLDTSDYRSSDENIFDLDAYKEELFHINEYNSYLSDRLPINRIHKDPRSEKCRNKAKKLPPTTDLPKSSIIIVMYNEELSVLLRTIVSILLNTPMEAVQEVLIIDDKSSRDELGDRLDKEMRAFPFVKIIRNSKREGLIRSRIIGSKAAEGSILIFLDSHVEMGQGWIEPLAARVMEDPKTVVCPTIATIDHTTLDLIADKAYSNIWGVWDWDMSFRWEKVPPRETQRRGFDESNPIRTPAMAGGLYAISKAFFFELGAYDPGMKIWGAENMEMSFRVWMCGGAIEINTCSIVGHIFRKDGVIAKGPSNELAVKQNVKRVIEVWLDDYKNTHYSAVPSNKNVDGGDVVSRVLLRQRLKCQTFEWYLNQVFPEQLRPERDLVAYGQLKGPSQMCMDTLGIGPGHQTGVFRCHGEGAAQFWKLLMSGELSNKGNCLDGDGNNPRNLYVYECHGLKGNQQWFLTEDGVIQHGGSGKCLSHDGTYLLLLPCDPTDPRFIWSFGAENSELMARFYDIHSKQFQYKTKREVEKEKFEKEERRAAAQRQREEVRKQREEEKEKNTLHEKSGTKEEVEEKPAVLSEAEREFQEWKAEKKKREEEARRREEEEIRKAKELEAERQKQEELKKQREEEIRKLEEEKKRKEEEEERKQFQLEKRRLQEKEEIQRNELAEESGIDEAVKKSNQTSFDKSSKKLNEKVELSSEEEKKIRNLEKQAKDKETLVPNETDSDSDDYDSVVEDNDAEIDTQASENDSEKSNSKVKLDNEQLKEFLAWKAAQGSA